MADVVVSPYLHNIVELFSPNNPGRAFALFRHPMDRAIGIYKSSQHKDTMSMEEFYSDGNLVDNNWMTRHLTNKMGGSLNEKDLNHAMETLRRKFIVGLVDQVRESVKRFTLYFGWKTSDETEVKAKANECISQVIKRTGGKEMIEEGSELWNLILKHNQWDMRLFKYVEHLFKEQGVGIPKPIK